MFGRRMLERSSRFGRDRVAGFVPVEKTSNKRWGHMSSAPQMVRSYRVTPRRFDAAGKVVGRVYAPTKKTRAKATVK